jgi:hypothetical protein
LPFRRSQPCGGNGGMMAAGVARVKHPSQAGRMDDNECHKEVYAHFGLAMF